MQINPTDAAALQAVLRKDLAAVARLEEHVSSFPWGSLRREQLESVGFSLHNLYNALENSFTQISLSFENHVKDRSRWHRELLEKMFLPIPPVRPAVLPPAAKPLLVDLLSFRHLFRHSYELGLEEVKLRALTARWMEEGRVVKEAVEAFAQALAQVAAHEDSASTE